MHPSIEKLLRVQDVDTRILFMREAMRVRPEELNDDRVRAGQAEEQVAAIESRIRAAKMASDRREVDIKEFDQEIRKLTIALNQAKTNAEYSVIRDGVERQKERRGEAEEDVLARFTEIDALEEERRAAQSVLDATRKLLDRKEAEMQELLAGLQSQVDEFDSRREGLLEGIDPEHLHLYERVLAHYRNFAVTEVIDQVCKGCNMRLTPQEVNLLMQNQFVQCRNCTRLLLLGD